MEFYGSASAVVRWFAVVSYAIDLFAWHDHLVWVTTSTSAGAFCAIDYLQIPHIKISVTGHAAFALLEELDIESHEIDFVLSDPGYVTATQQKCRAIVANCTVASISYGGSA